MAVTLSIKNVPDELAQRLKERAAATTVRCKVSSWPFWRRSENPSRRRIDEIYGLVEALGGKDAAANPPK